MDTPQQTRKFSAHLSWAAMRRYLQEKMSPEDAQRVARHLRHCTHCSSAIVDYIRSEEPQHYKLYTKKLKGITSPHQVSKRRTRSAFPTKAIQVTVAVVALVVLSFFAIKTVVNQPETDRALPSESLATTESTAERLQTKRKEAKELQATEAPPLREENQEEETKKKVTPPAEDQPVQKPVPVKKAQEERSGNRIANQPSVASQKDERATPKEEPTSPEASTEDRAPQEQEMTNPKPVTSTAEPKVAEVETPVRPEKARY